MNLLRHHQKISSLSRFPFWMVVLSGLITFGLAGCAKDAADELATGALPAESEAQFAGRYKDAVDEVMASMTLEQKIGQMIQGEIKHVTPEDVRKYGLGSVLNGGGSFPDKNRHATLEDWQQLADAYYRASVDTSGGGAGIPLTWGTDAVHGHSNVIGTTLFPHNIGLGAANDPALVAAIAAATAKETLATGIDWIFAPTVAVAKDYRWGRAYESYSSDPVRVGSYAGDFVTAMQGEGVIATAKHFIGDGGTYQGDDQGDTRLSLEALLSEHGAGYESAIESGVWSVMASFNSWHGEKVHGNRELLTDVLKGKMGFQGMVVSDWNGIGQVRGCKDDDCVQAVNAGIDMIMIPEDWKSLYHNMLRQVRSGEIPMERIDDAVRRILTVKFASGLMTRGLPSETAAKHVDSVGSAEHRAIARTAVRKSLVLLKNEEGLLPLDPGGRYLLVGPAADDIGRQSGGWTISWQGTGNENADFPGATSIRGGFAEQIEAAGGVLYTEGDLDSNPEIDAVIVAYGEAPYAEGQGDIQSLAWQQQSQTDLKVLQRFAEAGYPVVSLFVTGRPRWVNAELNASDAFVVAWLPGSEGGGVADVMLRAADGSPQYDFVGRLPMAWPAHDINADDANLPVAKHLFPVGYGLSAGEASQLAQLDETPVGAVTSEAMMVFAGGIKEPWSLYIGDQADWAVPITSAVQTSVNGVVAIESFDYRVQEDARRIEFSGGGVQEGQFFIDSDVATDLSKLAEEGGALVMEMRVSEQPTAPVSLRMDCGYPCSGEMDISPMLAGLLPNVWKRVAYPLACFENAGTDMSAVDVPFLLVTAGNLGFDLAEISINDEFDDAELQACDVTPDE